MSTLRIETPRKLLPLLASHMPSGNPVRYRGAYGGRGGTKSHFFAGQLVKKALLEPGLLAVCVREIQKSLGQSVKRLIENKIQDFGVGAYFRILQTHIETPGGGRIEFQGMQNHTAESIKSLEGYRVCWVEEAQSLSARSLALLRPTIREEWFDDTGALRYSEIWFSWNPQDATDPVDKLLRGKVVPKNTLAVEVNWQDNPWFPQVLRDEMEYDLANDPDKYAWVWGGSYRQLTEQRILKNWRVAEFEPATDEEVLRFGGDWGFSVDPSVLIRLFVRGRQMFLEHEAYMVGCEVDYLPFLFGGTQDEELNALNAEAFAILPAKFKGLPGVPGSRKWPIKADSSNPQTISYMRRHGFPGIKGAKKGPGSVDEGIQRLQSFEIVCHPRCQRAAIELASYRFKTDKHTGDILPIPEDRDNHYIDSLRYATEGLRGGKSGSWGVV